MNTINSRHERKPALRSSGCIAVRSLQFTE